MIDYDAVLKNPSVRATLDEQTIAEAQSDEDILPDLISEEAELVLILGWETGAPGGSGANYVQRWRGLYFFESTDFDPEGPFDTLEAVLSLEYFRFGGTPQPELSSNVLSLDKLLEIAEPLVRREGDRIRINEQQYHRSNGLIVSALADD